MYYRARYYDPSIGRFLSADTIVPNGADAQSFNRYAYVRNNPVANTDPTGHECWGLCSGGIGLGGFQIGGHTNGNVCGGICNSNGTSVNGTSIYNHLASQWQDDNSGTQSWWNSY
jgi:uncharacterized protein RhaS with RHS repeats